MIDRVYYLVEVIAIVVCAIMGICFLTFPIPKHEELKNYRNSLKILSGAYFIMAFLNIAILIFNLHDSSQDALSFISVLLFSIQTFLFGFAIINLLNPDFVSIGNRFWQLLAMAFITILYFLSAFAFGDPICQNIFCLLGNLPHPTLIIRLLFFLLYLAQLVYFSWNFYLEETAYESRLKDFFSEEIQLKLPWVRLVFLLALLLNLFLILASFFPSKLFDIVNTIVMVVFYLVFAVEYIQYPNVFRFIHPVVVPMKQEPLMDPIFPLSSGQKWTYYKKIILEQKYFLRTGITIEELATLLHIGRSTLSQFINGEEKVNFNKWVNTLRIEEAKMILLSHPDYTASAVSEMVGYSEPANFSFQFKQVTGTSFSTWKKSIV